MKTAEIIRIIKDTQERLIAMNKTGCKDLHHSGDYYEGGINTLKVVLHRIEAEENAEPEKRQLLKKANSFILDAADIINKILEE